MGHPTLGVSLRDLVGPALVGQIEVAVVSSYLYDIRDLCERCPALFHPSTLLVMLRPADPEDEDNNKREKERRQKEERKKRQKREEENVSEGVGVGVGRDFSRFGGGGGGGGRRPSGRDSEGPAKVAWGSDPGGDQKPDGEKTHTGIM